MRYVDYGWELSKDGLVFDDDLDIKKLEWHEGDYFVLRKIDGKNTLIKVDPLIQFLKDGDNV